ERLASVRLAPLRSDPTHTTEGSAQPANWAPERSAKLRSTPARLALVKSAPGQFVKFVDVGLETMVQPSTTVSAEAGVDVARTGVTKATAMTRTAPVTRTRRPNSPNMTHPPINRPLGRVHTSRTTCRERRSRRAHQLWPFTSAQADAAN